MNLCTSRKILSIFSTLPSISAIVVVLSLGCSVPAAPQQPFAGRNLGGQNGCPTTTKAKKKTSAKKSVSLVNKKSSKDEEEEDTEEDETTTDCEDQPNTANGAGTTPLVTNGIVAPGQTAPGTSVVPGALPTTPLPTPAPAAAPTYSGAIKAYLDQACTSCHSGGFLRPAPNLSNYNDAMKNASSSLTTMKAGTMPKATKATDAEIKTFEAWISAGTPQ